MKLIIDVDEKLVCEGFERHFTEEEKNILIRAIGNGTPYKERTGDYTAICVGYLECIRDMAIKGEPLQNFIEGKRCIDALNYIINLINDIDKL